MSTPTHQPNFLPAASATAQQGSCYQRCGQRVVYPGWANSPNFLPPPLPPILSPLPPSYPNYYTTVSYQQPLISVAAPLTSSVYVGSVYPASVGAVYTPTSVVGGNAQYVGSIYGGYVGGYESTVGLGSLSLGKL